MSKISQYLNEHTLGEVTSNEYIRQQFSRDGSILSITPELVVHPRLTNDIRKIARFTWQLAEKGHIIPITVRGGGTDQTGAAIGSGIIISTVAHLNNIIYINLKDKDQFVHVQPGVMFGTLNEALKTHGIFIPGYPASFAYSTIGGAIANNTSGPLSGSYGIIGDSVSRLEVILANGDVIETGRISKHDLTKKKGLQTLEGEIYRKIDGIIDDNQQIITEKIAPKVNDHVGYAGIAKVKERDGSFDLTPLFIGSQGTLGIIAEMVVKTQFYSSEESIIVASFKSAELARDTADQLMELKPTVLEYIDGGLFAIARSHGKKCLFDNPDPAKNPAAVLYISFNDFGAKARSHKMKHALKKLSKVEAGILTNEDFSDEELHAIREVSSITIQSESKDESYPPLINGASIPSDRLEDFITAVRELAFKHHIELPLQIQWLNHIIHTRSVMQLHTLVDKQKTFKLISDYAELVKRIGGVIAAESGEGRLKTAAIYAQTDDDVMSIYSQVRTVFDPFGTMNPGVKQPTEVKTLVSQMNPSFNLADIAKYSPQS